MSWNQTIFDGAEAYEWISDGWRMVAVSAYGPRIAYLGKEQGDNLLYWDTAPGAERGEWKLRGGHRVWLTRPQADESEDTYGCQFHQKRGKHDLFRRRMVANVH